MILSKNFKTWKLIRPHAGSCSSNNLAIFDCYSLIIIGFPELDVVWHC